MDWDRAKRDLRFPFIILIVLIGIYCFLELKNVKNNLSIMPNNGRLQSYNAETCIANDEASEIEYFMYDDDENFSKILVKDSTAYVFDKDGQIVNVFSGFRLTYDTKN